MSDLERLESVKAGCLGAIAFTVSYLITWGLNYAFWANHCFDLLSLGLKMAIALISGFLFAVTYRYIIRNDNNSHLKDGAVFAFGLVRGLVPVEMSPNFLDSLGQLSLLGIESILCFTIARLTLDFAFHRRWIKPFNS
ncbi:hypothetical protein [Crocosphaera sp. XPORK-15E]|uniref:hypothetical protein n=1 Tax=Crocosphaera sp. XPORK-15E TaxID=3110247 RepID=UPI002B1F7378|nr:hypothetical protein [Crocosphaera sp. XPORK-15E]MEA5532454.1 hypothetical protein [Crocosphaera sp. XPORK-15E]